MRSIIKIIKKIIAEKRDNKTKKYFSLPAGYKRCATMHQRQSKLIVQQGEFKCSAESNLLNE